MYQKREKEVYMEFVSQICRALAYETKWVDEIYVDATHLTKKSRKNQNKKFYRIDERRFTYKICYIWCCYLR